MLQSVYGCFTIPLLCQLSIKGWTANSFATRLSPGFKILFYHFKFIFFHGFCDPHTILTCFCESIFCCPVLQVPRVFHMARPTLVFGHAGIGGAVTHPSPFFFTEKEEESLSMWIGRFGVFEETSLCVQMVRTGICTQIWQHLPHTVLARCLGFLV